MTDEAAVQCPYCWETVALELDESEGEAEFTYDCPVCCNPMLVRVRLDMTGARTVEVAREND